MTTPGRNEPCPCGSGRKFKHCHGRPSQASDSPKERTWRRLRDLLDGYPAKMLRFVRDVYGPGVVQEAWEEFLLWGDGEDDDLAFDPDTLHMQAFMPWFFHRWSPDPMETGVEDEALHQRAPTRVLLERRGRRLDPLLKRYLEACVDTPFSFHEIVRCEPGVGFRARDLFLGDEHEVLERSASRIMQPGDAFFGQLVTCDEVTLMEGCGPSPIPPGRKIGLIELRERMEGSPHPPASDTFADWDLELRDAYLQITEALLHPVPPVLQNTDGDEIAFHRMRFAISSPQRAFDALKDLAFDETEDELLAEAERDEGGSLQRVSFVWKASGNRLHAGWDNTVLGHIEVDGTRLMAEVNSAERAARLRTMVEERLGDEVRHEATEVRSVEEAQEAERTAAGELESGMVLGLAEHPEVRERLRQATAAHYEGWVSEKLPVLGGRTPLEAVRDRAGREKVVALVDQIERGGRGQEPPLDETIVRTLRERLGLR